eukprot:TRINITY_DN2452_c0_g1_i1.p1 TRINITY_DN2452_c0_g1~~TRINITY_DN2452_c0_g1_i1.p1  ORF type:complete len:1058 (+),score=237.18 TRINITY_DN2452_c0_g1_i1:1390-4563(+)
MSRQEEFQSNQLKWQSQLEDRIVKIESMCSQLLSLFNSIHSSSNSMLNHNNNNNLIHNNNNLNDNNNSDSFSLKKEKKEEKKEEQVRFGKKKTQMESFLPSSTNNNTSNLHRLSSLHREQEERINSSSLSFSALSPTGNLYDDRIDLNTSLCQSNINVIKEESSDIVDREDAQVEHIFQMIPSQLEQSETVVNLEVVGENDEEIVINPNRPHGTEEVKIPIELSRVLLPHQVEGVRFLWENTVYMKGIEGCLLADSMGLGKTLQMISLLSVLFLRNQIKTALIVTPSTTIANWEAEFFKWLSPIHRPRLFTFQGKNGSRIEYLKQWKQQGGVFLLSFEMFRQLTYVPVNVEPHENVLKYKNFLCDPGADLVVVDEGHKISNPSSNITESLKSIKTTKRVVLTGYPLQNRLGEYWCMVDFIRPNYFGTLHEFRQMFENPIANGLCIDSRPADVQLAKRRMYVLTRLLKPFFKRRDFSCLRDSLPTKHEFVIGTCLSTIQKKLYLAFLEYRMNYFKSEPHAELLAAQHIFLKIINHPDVLRNSIQKNKCLNEDLQNEQSNIPIISEEGVIEEESIVGIDFSWAEELMKGYERGDLSNGPKLFILLQIIRFCREEGEKILIFSQSVQTLNVIQQFINDQNNICHSGEILHYFRIDGGTPLIERQRQIDAFNSKNSRESVFLLSTKAGGLGINLTAANRVVLFDSSWNPSHDVESIYRAYRFGQTKEVHIYRLISGGTIESRIYDRQIIKQGLFRNVIDEKNPKRTIPKVFTRDLFKLDTVVPLRTCSEGESLVKEKDSSNDPILFKLFSRYFPYLTQLHEHESFLEEDDVETVDYNDRRQVDEFINKETNLSSETWRRMVLMENRQTNQIRFDANGNTVVQVKPNMWSQRIEKTVQNMLGEPKSTSSIDLEDLEYYGISEEKGEEEEDLSENHEVVFQSNSLSVSTNNAKGNQIGRKRSFAPIINKTTTLNPKEDKRSNVNQVIDSLPVSKKTKTENNQCRPFLKNNAIQNQSNENTKKKSREWSERSKRMKNEPCKFFQTKSGCQRDGCFYSHGRISVD